MNPFQKKEQVDLEIFAIYDSITNSYRNPIFAPNHLDLQRAFINQMKDQNQADNQFFTNAEDFSIFRIGTYDRKTGNIQLTNKERVAYMHELKALARPEVKPQGIVST